MPTICVKLSLASQTTFYIKEEKAVWLAQDYVELGCLYSAS